MFAIALGMAGPALAADPSGTDTTLIIADVVNWLGADQPQMHQAALLQTILDNLSIPYSSQQITRNRARIWVSEQPLACMPWLIKTLDRADRFQFSLPYMLENSLRLVVKKDSKWAATLTEQLNHGEISLRDLMTQKQPPVLGIESNRSYGTQADILLQGLKDFPAVYTRTSSSNQITELLPMLQREFVDIIIEYETLLINQDEQLVYFAFKETEPFQLGHFACSNTAAMTELMPLLNQAIRTLTQDPAYQQLMLQGIPASQHKNALLYLQQAP
ncbi:hypothetical protein WG68_00980 [Arsukibacterium ikkense]|uniref:Solute-binding protein family 3/N-terminal domain-containing protein n=2 Tax=Arsukibacterium ikkense TaxID=336831 RepID=A0A0M2VDP7_9GAMM|nr:hypothetical protein WG68_00980 [Arsukibacterium ikkense]